MNKKLLGAAGAIALALIANSARGGTSQAVYDFENEPITNNGGFTTLSMTNNGLTITLDRVGQPFDITNLSSMNGTAGFGSRTLSPTPPGQNFFNADFSTPVSSFSVQMGDFVATNNVDSLALTAFSGPNGTGANLGTSSATLPMINSTTLASTTLQISKPGIQSVQFIGGTTDDANSVYYDNLIATYTPASGTGSGTGSGNTGSSAGASVPLPPALYVAPLGALLAWFAARRLRRLPQHG